MANLDHDVQPPDAPLENEIKVEDCPPVDQYPPYQGWSQHYPGYLPHPWYPPYQQQQDLPVKQEIDASIKQETNQLSDVKKEDSPSEDRDRQIQSFNQYPPQQVPPHLQYPPHSQYPPPSQYPPQNGSIEVQNRPQPGALQYPYFYPPYNSYPPQGFANHPMPAWNPNGQYYNQFQHHPQSFQQIDQNDDNKDFQRSTNGDTSLEFAPNITSDLDSSSERTSDLGSSLNSSTSEEFQDKSTGTLQSNSRRKYTEWEEDELTLLPGWKKRSYQHGRIRKYTLFQYISPSMELFDSRGQMVEHLELTGHSEEEVAKVKLGSRLRKSNRGWEEDENLPKGWKRKFTEWNRGTGQKMGRKYSYLAPNNRVFTSRTQVVLFMRNSDEYSEEDVQKVLSKTSGIVKVEDGPHSSSSRMISKDPRLCYNDWADDESLPVGWKSRFTEWKNGDKRSKKYTYLAPDNRLFSSRMDVVSFMRNSKEYSYSEDDVQKVIAGGGSGRRDPNHPSNYSDWVSDESLPSGWKKRFKDWKNGNRMSKKFTYLAPNNQIFHSRTEVVLFMRKSGAYSEDDVQRAISGSLQGKATRAGRKPEIY